MPPSTAPVTAPPAGEPDALALASALGPLPLPTDCPLPLGESESLPNAARDYRGGVHEGIDFICGEYGHDAKATMDGQVLIADASFVDPEPSERVEILDIAKQIGHTPPWTLAMLFGRFVVIDHGIRPNVGHVVTIYAHLNEIDPAIVPGHHVKAGDRIGEVGNAGTESAGTGEKRPQAIHLHWEIHIDDRFLADGASSSDTSAVYGTLFGRS
jgi:murein DD-endopeptidase MepM/ murein hydrolase activator NlpD